MPFNDFTSLITDSNQSTWLSQPPSGAPRSTTDQQQQEELQQQQHTSKNRHQLQLQQDYSLLLHQQQEDFVLFPQESRQIRGRLTSEFVPVISSTALEERSYDNNNLSASTAGSPQQRFNNRHSDSLRTHLQSYPSVNVDISSTANTITTASHQNPFSSNSPQQYQLGYSSATQTSPRFNSTGININNNNINNHYLKKNNSNSRKSSDSLQSEVILKTNNIRPPVPLFNSAKHKNLLEGTNSSKLSSGMKPDSILHLCAEKPITDLSTEMTRNIDSHQGYPSNGFGPLGPLSFGLGMQTFFTKDQRSSFDLANETTISPRDLLMDASVLRCPPSGEAFTNFSTPGSHIFDSDYDESCQYTGTNETLVSNLDSEIDPEASGWPSLFGQPAAEDSVTLAGFEQESSVPMSRTASGQRFSSSVGIVKPARRTNKALVPLRPELEIDPRNKKRMKNTEAARKSRAKKENERGELVAEIERLRQEIDLKNQDITHWRGKYLACVKNKDELAQLEAQNHSLGPFGF